MNCDCLYCFENNRENTLYGYIVGVKRFPFLKFKWIYVNKDKCGHMDFFKMDKDSIYYKENYEPKPCKLLNRNYVNLNLKSK